VVKGLIVQVEEWGVLLKLSDSIKALCPLAHLSDAPRSKISAKFVVRTAPNPPHTPLSLSLSLPPSLYTLHPPRGHPGRSSPPMGRRIVRTGRRHMDASISLPGCLTIWLLGTMPLLHTYNPALSEITPSLPRVRN
jgi:hypothetical protein